MYFWLWKTLWKTPLFLWKSLWKTKNLLLGEGGTAIAVTDEGLPRRAMPAPTPQI